MKMTLRLLLVLGLVICALEDAQAICNASWTCWDGSVVSCSGNTTCTVTSGTNPEYVTCDGVRTSCPRYCASGVTCTTVSQCIPYCQGINPLYHGNCHFNCCECF